MATKKTNTEINGRSYYRMTRSIDGRKKQFYGRSKGEAERKYREYLEQYLREQQTIAERNDKASFAERANEYIKDVLAHSQRYANSTKDKYEEAYRCHIKGSDLDKMRVRDIKPYDVQKFYNSLDVSKQTIQNVSKFMNGFCRWLMLNGFADDFISAVELPKKPDNKKSETIVVWSDEEVRCIIDGCTRLSLAFRPWFMPILMIYTGFRLCEVLSLKYTDFEDGMLTVRRQYTHGEIKEPKYGSSRSIPIHDEVQAALKKHMMWHTLEMKKNGYSSPYLFTTSTGHLYHPSNIRTALRRFYKRIGIEYKETHTYRRTFCTRLCKAGVPIQTASELMGHKNIAVTARFYASISDQEKISAISKL